MLRYEQIQQGTGAKNGDFTGSSGKEGLSEMGVYGFGLIGAFMFAGCFLGNLLGNALGLGSDVGGVGFSMVFLILFQIWLEKKGKTLHKATEGGIRFLSGLYIPVVVAMSMNQDVFSALAHGLVPVLSGTLAVVISLLVIPLVHQLFVKE